MADEIEEVEQSDNSDDSVETAEPKDETDYKVAYEKTKEALRKEREISKAAEKKAKEAERSVEKAKTVEERLSAIETENQQLKLEKVINEKIKDHLSDLKKDGFVVNEKDLRDILSDVQLTESNASEKIEKFASKLKTTGRVQTPENTQHRADVKNQIDPKSPPSLTDVFK